MLLLHENYGNREHHQNNENVMSVCVYERILQVLFFYVSTDNSLNTCTSCIYKSVEKISSPSHDNYD